MHPKPDHPSGDFEKPANGSSQDLEASFFDPQEPLFEHAAKENGFTYWHASKLSEMLGYANADSLHKAINKAQRVCLSLDINISEHFKQDATHSAGGSPVKDMRLSRFACYLVTMNADIKKKQVAAAQAYFATLAEACQRYIKEVESVERVVMRDEISEHENSLSSTAKRAGVEYYQYFQNAGYRGLYNLNINQLKTLKGIPANRSPLDFMGTTELAANLFRITQTDEKIKKEGITGQSNLERTAHSVGRKVRATMEDISGVKPEELKRREDIRKVKTDLKFTQRGMAKLDKKKKPKRLKDSQ